MFDLWRLKRERKLVFARYEKSIREARQQNNHLEATDLAQKQFDHCDYLDEQLNEAMSDAIRAEARDLDIKPPDIDSREMWWRDQAAHPHLTPQGRYTMRKLIDEEKARRFEIKTLWVTKLILPIFAALVGIIGGLTGLIAVMHKK